MASLHHYTNNEVVEIYREVNGDPQDEPCCPLDDLKWRKHRAVLLITTWGSKSLAEKMSEFLTAHSVPFGTLMFAWLHDPLPWRSFTTTLSPLKLRDIAILTQIDVLIGGVSNEPEHPLSIPINHLVKEIPPRSQDPVADLLDRIRGWIQGQEELSWDLLDANVVTMTETALCLLKCLRTDTTGKRSFLIHKQYPGSGATTLVRSVGWTLARSGEARVFVVKASLTSEFWRRVCAEVPPTDWLVLLVDEDINPFCDGLASSNVQFRVTVVRVVLNRSTKAFTLSPILSQDCLVSMCSQLCHTIIVPEVESALEGLVIYAAEHPEERENRHLYVVMLTATQATFVPPRRYFESQILKLNDAEREAISFLALLSLYSIPFPRVSIHCLDSLPAEAALGLTSLSNRQIGFVHPSLADLFLAVAFEGSSEQEVIWKTFDSFRSVASRVLRVTARELNLLYRSILIETPSMDLTFFQQRIVDGRCDASVVDTIFGCEAVRRNCDEGCRQIACSRVHRHLGHFDRALQEAREASSVLEQNTKKNNLAKSNLAEALGASAVAHLNQDHLREMSDLFKELHMDSRKDK
jgi:hypothetical protein